MKLTASGRAVAILRRHGLDVVPIDGMAMHFRRGGVRRGRSLWDLVRRAPGAIVRNAQVALHEVLAFDPDLLVTDFDSFTPLVGALLRRPVISVDHQHVLDRFRHPTSVKEAVSLYRIARALVIAKTPRCEHYVVTSFFFPEARWGSTSLAPRVIRASCPRCKRCPAPGSCSTGWDETLASATWSSARSTRRASSPTSPRPAP